MVKVEIYAWKYCPYCNGAKKLLKKKGVKYINYEVDIHSSNSKIKNLDEMIKRSNGRKSVPQIFIDNKHIGGFDDLKKLDKDKKLDKLLKL